jgi:hypothetical protein
MCWKTYALNVVYRWTRLKRIVGEKLLVGAITHSSHAATLRRTFKSIHCAAWVDLGLPAHTCGRLFLAWSRLLDRCTNLLLNSETQLVDGSRMFTFLERFNENG